MILILMSTNLLIFLQKIKKNIQKIKLRTKNKIINKKLVAKTHLYRINLKISILKEKYPKK